MSSPVADANQRYSSPRGLIELWTGVLLAPLAWAFHLLISYVFASTICGSGSKIFLFAGSAVFLALAFAGSWYSWINYKRIGSKWPKGEHDGVMVRSRFIAVAGMALGCLSFLLIVAQTIPMLLLEPCK